MPNDFCSKPAGHSTQASGDGAPTLVENWPVWQAIQDSTDTAAAVEEYLPLLQSIHFESLMFPFSLE
jgi:hypothetical protein